MSGVTADNLAISSGLTTFSSESAPCMEGGDDGKELPEALTGEAHVVDDAGDFNARAEDKVTEVTAESSMATPLYSREEIQATAGQMIEEINAKRKHDTKLLEDYKTALECQVKETYERVEQKMFSLYESQDPVINEKLEELNAALDRISKLESELDTFKASLGIFYRSVAQGDST